MRFDKYQGLGNDFILLDTEGMMGVADESFFPPAAAVTLCDRRFGIGADGVLVVGPARSAGSAARMRVINADGSIPGMCGNGLRCVALHLSRRNPIGKGTVPTSFELRIETAEGGRVCRLERSGSVAAMVTTDMGPVRVLGDQAVNVGGRSVVVAVPDEGNPHAVLFGDFARSDVEELGPRIERHADFPRGTNVAFARIAGGAFDLVVWERGMGITRACSTGASATVAVARAKGLVPTGEPVTVHLPGGDLQVTIGEGGHATIRGPASHVFQGRITAAVAGGWAAI
jgi:diaminopimelate epimerase